MDPGLGHGLTPSPRDPSLPIAGCTSADSCRGAVFFVGPAADDADGINRQCPLKRFCLYQGARIHTSRSSGVVRIAGLALGWIGLTIRVRRCCQESIDQVRTGHRFRLWAAIALERDPEAGEREQRTLVVDCEPNHVLLAGRGICFRHVFGTAAGWHKSTVFRLEPSRANAAMRCYGCW